MDNISHIELVSIPVQDQEAAKAFYRDKIGFAIVRDNPMGPGRRWIQLGPPKSQASITLVTWFEKMPPGCVQGLVLSTADITFDRQALVARGVAISEVQDAPWGRFATFSDLDGNGWVLQEPRPGV